MCQGLRLVTHRLLHHHHLLFSLKKIYLFGCIGSQLWCIGSRVHRLSSHGAWGKVALWHVGSQFPDQGLNPHPLLWKVDS